MYLGTFRNCIKLGAKRGELVQLMQKLVPQSHVVIFLNERTQSTLVDPKHRLGLFHSISVHLGSFRNCMKLDAKHTELVQLIQKFVT